MRPRIGFKKLAVAGAVAAVGVASTIALTSGSATASTTYGYSAFAHGTYVFSGLADSGPQVSSIIACTGRIGLLENNDIATANVNKQAIARTVTTEAVTHNDQRGNGSRTTATAADINLGKLLTLKGVETYSSAVTKDGKFEATGDTEIAAIKIGGVSVPKLLDAKPNTRVTVPGLGFIVLNYQKLSTTGSSATANAAAVMIHSTVRNKHLPKGATVAVLLTKAEVGGPQAGVLRGMGYGSEASVGDQLKSGPSSLQTMCISTDSKKVSQGVAEIKVPGLLYVGGVTTTKQGSVTADSATANVDATTAGVTIGRGKNEVAIEAVTSWASATKSVGKNTVLDSGSKVGSVRVGDKVIPIPQGINQKVEVPGIATLTFNKVDKRGSVISVTALEVDVKALDMLVQVAFSEAGVVA